MRGTQYVICEGILVESSLQKYVPTGKRWAHSSFIWSCYCCLRRCMSSSDSAKIHRQEIRASEPDSVNTDLKHMCLEPQHRFSVAHAKGVQPDPVPQGCWWTTGSLPSSLRALKRPAELWACTQNSVSLIQKKPSAWIFQIIEICPYRHPNFSKRKAFKLLSNFSNFSKVNSTLINCFQKEEHNPTHPLLKLSQCYLIISC